MPTERKTPDPISIITEPVSMYLTRLPDDEREITKTIVGVLARGINRVFVRGAWDPDVWDALKLHRMWNVPRPLLVKVSAEERGVVCRVGVVVPMKFLPKSLWPKPKEGDEWKGETHEVDPREPGWLPIGTLVRAKSKLHHDTLHDEGLCIVLTSITGRQLRHPVRDDD